MRRVPNRIGRLLITALAAGSMFAATTTPAVAGRYGCGTTVNDYGKIGLTSCWYDVSGEPGPRPTAVLHSYSAMDPELWTGCALEIEVWQQYETTSYDTEIWESYTDCLSAMQYLSVAPGQYLYFQLPPFPVGAGACYRVVSRWYGTYNSALRWSNTDAVSHGTCGLANALLNPITPPVPVPVPAVVTPI